MTDKLDCNTCLYSILDANQHPCDDCNFAHSYKTEIRWVENHSIELGRKLDMVIALLQKLTERI